MRALLIALTMVAIAWTCRSAEGAGQVQRMLDSAPLRWTGVEVVTNDFDSVQRLRNATGLKPGTILFRNDPRLRRACKAVRREEPGAAVSCSLVFSGKINGYIPAVFIVEINVAKRTPLVPPECSSASLAPDLMALTSEWMSAEFTNMGAGKDTTEHVNAGRFLDYGSPPLHRLAERVHSVVAPRMSELERASVSCAPASRVDAIYLMNFTGDPAHAIHSAILRMRDPDPGVRNAAMRFLWTFDEFITPVEVAGISKQVCEELISGGATDRNKSLLLLNGLHQRKLVRLSSLSASCQREIRGIARTSIAGPTGDTARKLVQSGTSQIRR